jgi:hypothetical protein
MDQASEVETAATAFAISARVLRDNGVIIMLGKDDLKHAVVWGTYYGVMVGVGAWGTYTLWKRDVKPLMERRKRRKDIKDLSNKLSEERRANFGD